MNLAASVFYDNQQKHLNIWWQGALFLSVLFAINAVISLLDARLLGDEALWIKPLKFETSIIIHFTTLAVLASLLSPTRRSGVVWRGLSYATVAAGIFEVLYIFLQAARGRESHFNITTVAESVMYSLMGFGAVILVLGSFYLGCMLYREYRLERNNALLLSSALGLTIGSVLTLIIAGYLSSQTSGLVVLDTHETLRAPVFGWYLNGKDLRFPHFLATHMMQLMPLYGLWLRRKNMPFKDSQIRIILLVGSYSAVVIALFTATFLIS